MIDLLPRPEPRGTSHSPHLSLIDYVVLEFIERWEAGAEERPGDGFGEKATQRQKAALLSTVAELARRGYPLELALEFSDYTQTDADFVRSPAIDLTLMALAEQRFIQAAERGFPIIRLTSDGHGLLKILRSRMQPVETAFLQLPSAYFLTSDLLHARSTQTHAKQPIRRTIASLANVCINKSADDLKESLVNLGFELARSGATPRTYRFARRYLRSRSSSSEPGASSTRPRSKIAVRKEFAY